MNNSGCTDTAAAVQGGNGNAQGIIPGGFHRGMLRLVSRVLAAGLLGILGALVLAPFAVHAEEAGGTDVSALTAAAGLGGSYYYNEAVSSAAKAYSDAIGAGSSEEMAMTMANKAVLNYVALNAASTGDAADDAQAAQLISENEERLQSLTAKEQAAAEAAAAQAAAAEATAIHNAQVANGTIHEAYAATADERTLLAAIIYCEAGNQPENGKVGVGNVVLNRVRSSKFPNNIHDVIYQKGQFSPAGSGWLNRVLSNGSIPQDCYDAADQALAGATPVGNAVFFMRKELHSQGLIIKDHCFWGSM